MQEKDAIFQEDIGRIAGRNSLAAERGVPTYINVSAAVESQLYLRVAYGGEAPLTYLEEESIWITIRAATLRKDLYP